MRLELGDEGVPVEPAGRRGELDEGRGHLAEAGVGRPDHRHHAHRGMVGQPPLDLGGGHVLPADLEHVLEPADGT